MSDDEDYDRANDDPIAAAREARVPVVLMPEPNELFIDIDTPRALNVFRAQLEIFRRREKKCLVMKKPSRRKKRGFHILVRLEHDVTPTDRLMLQAMLGSDLRRELLGLQRLDDGMPEPTCFFEQGEPAVDDSSSTDEVVGIASFEPTVTTWRKHFGE